jgi:hypothetical protein
MREVLGTRGPSSKATVRGYLLQVSGMDVLALQTGWNRGSPYSGTVVQTLTYWLMKAELLWPHQTPELSILGWSSARGLPSCGGPWVTCRVLC